MHRPLVLLIVTIALLAAAMRGRTSPRTVEAAKSNPASPVAPTSAPIPPASPSSSISPAAGFSFPRVPPTEPKDAEKTFRTLYGFRMELLAAEPLVTDPVALEYDENGLAWVVEMRDYPYTDKSTDKPNLERLTDAPLGRIRILEDTDGDGRFDRSDVFAEDLSWPTGIALWKGGCYVTATPDVWYLKDTDGDRRADVRRKVFTGFKKLNVQAVMNNPRWGLDHRLYAAGATNGGEITKPGDPTFKPVRFGRADFSFDPNSEEFRVEAGGARFGQTFDDWGNRFLCNIRNPVQHVVIENRYLARNPFLPVTNVVHDVAEAGDTLPVYRVSPPEPWRTARAERWRAEAGQTYPRSELAGEGYFTSSSGITIYRGAAYPKEFYGNAFIGEVAGNLIHRQVLVPDGVTFKSHRGDENAEFVASTDNWFRPTNFTNAPDGTLHVCDMYRETIEHPWSIPDDMKPYLDLESGRDRGRLYRLAPPNFVSPNTWPRLGRAAAAELVATLENPNSWWRDTAHRLIYERQDKACIEPLRKLLRESKSELARMHALWSLEGLAALTEDDWSAAFFVDASYRVKAQALRVGEGRFASPSSNRNWRKYLLDGYAGGYGDDKAFLFQLALSSGASECFEPALARILRDQGDDVWITAAALSGAAECAVGLLKWDAEQFPELPTRTRLFSQYPADVARRLAMIVGSRAQSDEVSAVLAIIADAEGADRSKTLSLLAGLTEGLRRSNKTLSQFAGDEKTKAALKSLFHDAATNAVDEKQTIDVRAGALQLLAQSTFAETRPTLVALLDARRPAAVQIEAVRALAGFRDPVVPSLLLKNYKTLTPAVRIEIVEALASRPDRIGALLDAVEQKQVAAADIPQARKALILRSKDPEIAARAAKLLAQTSGARAAVIEKYRPALKLASDMNRGHAVFLRECKACHKLRGEGFEVGPNLATILHRSPDELLTHILDPNREVSPNFLEYVVELDDGRTMTGIVADETTAGLTLRKAENAQETVLRRNIEAMYATGKSLMPEGMEQKLTPQDAADLLAYLLQRR